MSRKMAATMTASHRSSSALAAMRSKRKTAAAVAADERHDQEPAYGGSAQERAALRRAAACFESIPDHQARKAEMAKDVQPGSSPGVLHLEVGREELRDDRGERVEGVKEEGGAGDRERASCGETELDEAHRGDQERAGDEQRVAEFDDRREGSDGCANGSVT